MLLYDEQDVERQFRMEALSELSRQDIAEILRGLRRARRGDDDTVVLTSGELLRDETLHLGFDAEDRQADTRVRVAVAWLERAGLVERNENRTRVFQGRPGGREPRGGRAPHRPARTLRRPAGALARGAGGPHQRRSGRGLHRRRAGPAARLQAHRARSGGRERPPPWDRGETAGLRVLRTLHDMANAGLLHQGPQLTAFLRHKVKNSSEQILRRVCALERAMLEALRQEAPDAETGDWLPLSLRRLNQHLLDEGQDSNPETLRNLLASLARDGRGLAAERGSLELRQSDRDHYRVKLHRDWAALTATAERRQAVAGDRPADPDRQGAAGRPRQCRAPGQLRHRRADPGPAGGPDASPASCATPWPPPTGGSCSCTSRGPSSCSGGWPSSARP